MTSDRYIGKTLSEIMSSSFMIARGCTGVSVFIKKPDDGFDAPGRKYAEDLNLGAILRNYNELNNAKIVNHSTYCGEHVFRVTMP